MFDILVVFWFVLIGSLRDSSVELLKALLSPFSWQQCHYVIVLQKVARLLGWKRP